MNQNNIPHGKMSGKFLNQEPGSWPKSKSGSLWISCLRKSVCTLLDNHVVTIWAKQFLAPRFLTQAKLSLGKLVSLHSLYHVWQEDGFSQRHLGGLELRHFCVAPWSCPHNCVSLIFLISAQKWAAAQFMPTAKVLWLEQWFEFWCLHPWQNGKNWNGFQKNTRK